MAATAIEKKKEAAELRKVELEIEKLELDTELARVRNCDLAADADLARTYSFLGSVDRLSVGVCMAKLAGWSRRDPGGDIQIVINSPGGNALDGLGLYDFIRSLRSQGHHIETLTLGMAASMGGILLQAGDHRVMARSAWMLIHEVSSDTWGKVSQIEDQFRFVERLQSRLVDILAERSTLAPAEIRSRWERKDWWLSADEALELGFVDEVR